MPFHEFEIIYGARAVWVNDATGCLGRFGVYGIDVHRTMDEQVAGLAECLFCTHGSVMAEDWPRFVEALQRFHQIDIRDQPWPAWLDRRSGSM
jgi:hypothetical protein